MRRLAAATALLLALPLLPAPARADVYEPKQVSSDAKWAIHVDVDSIRDTPAWDLIENKIKNSPDGGKGIENIEMISGMRFPQDLHDVTLYGPDYDAAHGVALIHAKVDRNQVEQMLAQAANYSSKKHNDHDVDGWTDEKGQQLYGCFHSDTLLVIGKDRDVVYKALDVLDGKATSAKPGDVVAPAAATKKGIGVVIAGNDLASMKQAAQSPVFNFIQSGCITLTAQDKNVVVHAEALAKSAKDAEKSKQALVGIKAIVDLMAGKQDAPEKTKLASEALTNLSVSAKDATITGDVTVSDDLLKRFDAMQNKVTHEPMP